MKQRKKPPKRRNTYAAIVRHLGRKIIASGKVYRRKSKHGNPRRHDGGFDIPGAVLSA